MQYKNVLFADKLSEREKMRNSLTRIMIMPTIYVDHQSWIHLLIIFAASVFILFQNFRYGKRRVYSLTEYTHFKMTFEELWSGIFFLRGLNIVLIYLFVMEINIFKTLKVWTFHKLSLKQTEKSCKVDMYITLVISNPFFIIKTWLWLKPLLTVQGNKMLCGLYHRLH